MKNVRITNLHCTKTQDWGDDECRLEIKRGSLLINKSTCKVKADQDCDFDYSNLFVSFYDYETVIVQLWDDDVSNDDNLGIIEITEGCGEYEGKFTNNGADYTLSYSIEYEPDREKTVNLTQLHCIKTQDVGTDECRLEVWQDDVINNEKTDTKKMDKGDNWKIGLSSNFNNNNKVEIKLWDEDWPSDDDDLGTIEIMRECGEYQGKFTKNGADYTLDYQIVNYEEGDDDGPHAFVDELYVEHKPVDVKFINKIAEHTYLVGKRSNEVESRVWPAFGSGEGGTLLEDTYFSQENGVDYDTVDYMMTQAPCIWPKDPYYAVVGVCWNACNRGLYYVHKTVHEIKFYRVVEFIYGTFGLEEDSKRISKKARNGRDLYNWQLALAAINANCPWRGAAILDSVMAKSENSRIRLYHEHYGDTALVENKSLPSEEHWFNYLQSLLKLNIRETLGEINYERLNKILDIHKSRFDLIHSIENIEKSENAVEYIESHLNELLEEFKIILSDEEYKLLFNADKAERFSLPV